VITGNRGLTAEPAHQEHAGFELRLNIRQDHESPQSEAASSATATAAGADLLRAGRSLMARYARRATFLRTMLGSIVASFVGFAAIL
jgi:hypothetical protein